MADGTKLKLNLADVEVIDRVEITDPETVKRIKAIKEQGLEGVTISIEIS